MNSKSILRVVLLAFAASAIGYLIIGGPRTAPLGSTSDVASDTGPEPNHHVIAYYFHGERRCPSCLQIEAYAKEAVESGFAGELRSGLLSWRVVNFEATGNEHFVKDYNLVSQSLIIADRHNGEQTRWQNLDQVWELLGNKQRFISYVQDSIRVYLEKS